LNQWLERFISSYNTGDSYEELGDKFFGDQDSVERRTKSFDKVNELIDRNLIVSREGIKSVSDLEKSSMSELVEMFQEAIGREHQIEYPGKRKDLDGKVDWVVLGDPHSPYERMDIISEICKKHEGSRLIIAGDLFTFESLSLKYEKRNHNESPMEVLKRGAALIEAMATHFEEVYIIEGNHDLRLPRYLAGATGDGGWFEIGLFIYDMILAPIKNARVIRAKINQGQETNLQSPLHGYFRVGDVAVTHLEVSGRPKLSAAMKAADFIRLHLPEEWAKINLIIQAHNHKVGFGKYEGKHLYECGALCYTEPYVFQSHKYPALEHGYVSFSQVDGVTVDHRLHVIEPPKAQVTYY
jgi:hypothetical protein